MPLGHTAWSTFCSHRYHQFVASSYWTFAYHMLLSHPFARLLGTFYNSPRGSCMTVQYQKSNLRTFTRMLNEDIWQCLWSTLVTESLVKHSPLRKPSLAADPANVPEETPCSFAWKCPKELEWKNKVGCSEERKMLGLSSSVRLSQAVRLPFKNGSVLKGLNNTKK